MACNIDEKRKFFTFTWKLENASYFWHKKKERLLSPSFCVDSIEKTKWRLSLYPRGKDNDGYISCGLNRIADNAGIENVEIDFEIAFMAEDGTTLKSSGLTRHLFQKGSKGYGFGEFAKRYDVYVLRRSIYLPQDRLIVRCRIWKSTGEVAETGQWIARTCMGVEKRSFMWNIEKFSTLEPGIEVTYSVMSSMNDNPILALKLFLQNEYINANEIQCKLVCLDHSIKYCKLRMFLLPNSENAVKCCQEEFWGGIGERTFHCFALNLAKREIMKSEKLYLPNDVLSLFCECNFSSGVVLDEIEKIIYECSESLTEKLPHLSRGIEPPLSDSSRGCKENTEHLYYDHFLCDIKLKTKTGVFPAHKKVLTDMSPVFEKILSNNLAEDSDECVFIDDMKDDTVRRVLLYMYADVVEDMQWKDAYSLYEAADKYQINSLKSKCTSILKSKLCPSNACEVLLFADFHQDDNMASVVKEFILKHDKDIINSEPWKHLVSKNMKLAADILYLKLKE